ncbi:hypothetical protein YYC_02816 [Plasmodium yoelii 17X]|uniref:YIR protein n=1 Tax=Plasmodium yoelii 17X TaxID=1323249 RepID=V7PK78_PLAYE|nr:hypothetical protein YYC_02816 [Plasmodium yoelii 17X]
MSKELCESINTIDKSFDDDPNNSEKDTSTDLIKFVFPHSKCISDEEDIISGFILLLNMIGNLKETIDSDKLVEYPILWLSYKLNQKKENGTTKLYDFYTNNIETSDCYDELIGTNSDSKIKKDVICKKIESMNIDIKDISNFYDAFKSLCNMYSELNENNNQCKTCFENAGELFEKYEKLKNALDINKGSSYYQLLSSLSDDYKKFKEKYNALECSSTLPFLACPRNSVTKNILIIIGIIFVAASILLGVSYKCSLFGFRKRSQKQKLREKIKK